MAIVQVVHRFAKAPSRDTAPGAKNERNKQVRQRVSEPCLAPRRREMTSAAIHDATFQAIRET